MMSDLERHINKDDLEYLDKILIGDYKFELISIRSFLLFKE